MEDLENTWHFSDLGEELEEAEEACGCLRPQSGTRGTWATETQERKILI